MLHKPWLVLVVIVIGTLAAIPAAAQLTPAYPSGIEGIKASSLPPPGFYLLNYFVNYRADRLVSGDGRSLPVDFDVEAPVLVVRPVWVFKHKLFGANLATDIVFPFVNVDLSVGAAGLEDSETGLGDVVWEPLVLSWNRKRYDIAAALTVFFPTGDWDADRPASVGKNYWTQMVTLGGTYYFDIEKKWSASILARYEFHDTHKDLNIRAGDDFHFEWGVGKKLNDLWEVGISGYSQWQVTDDVGDDLTWDGTVHDRVHGVGPDINYLWKKHLLLISFRSHVEFGAIDISEGVKTTLKVTKIF